MMCKIPFLKEGISWFEILSTVILPVVLFLSGYWLGVFIESFKEKRKKERLKKYFIQLIHQLNKKLEKQIIEINLAIERQDDYTSKKLMADRVSGESHKLLRYINREELYEIIVEKKKRKTEERTKLFDELMSKIDFVYEFLNVFEINLMNIPKSYSIYDKLWNDSQFELVQTYNLLVTTSHLHKGKDKLVDELSKIFTRINDLKGDKPYIDDIMLSYNAVIEPMNEILLSINDDVRTVKLMDLVQKSKFAFFGMREIRRSNKDNYLLMAERLEEVRKEILELLTKL